jgi:hypothetical protein
VGTAAAPGQDSSLPRQRILVVFSGLVLAMLLAALDSTIVSTAIFLLGSALCEMATEGEPAARKDVRLALERLAAELLPEPRLAR